MKIYDNLQGIQRDYPNISFGMTIGNFDGVHKGHQELIDQSKSICAKEKLKLILLSFTPHPKEFFSSELNDFYISNLNSKRERLELEGVDIYCELKFDHNLSAKTSEEFLNSFLDALILGYDFKFGSDKEKSIEVCKKFCTDNDILLDIVQALKVDNEIVSSSVIRDYIKTGDIHKANLFLGYNFSIQGRVKSGMGRGKDLGFPTANLDYDANKVIPSPGVYKTITTLDNEDYLSITNVGFNPTFADTTSKNIETHIFNLKDDIYGKTIKVKFFKKIRDEIRFNSLEELKRQITKDIEQVKKEGKC